MGLTLSLRKKKSSFFFILLPALLEFLAIFSLLFNCVVRKE